MFISAKRAPQTIFMTIAKITRSEADYKYLINLITRFGVGNGSRKIGEFLLSIIKNSLKTGGVFTLLSIGGTHPQLGDRTGFRHSL